MEAVSALFPFALILGAFYLLVIRPSRNRARAAAQMQQEVAVGTEVMTTSGMYGRITAVEDDAFGLEVSPGVTIRIAKAAVGKIVPDATVADDVTIDEDGAESSADSSTDSGAGTDLSGDDRPSR